MFQEQKMPFHVQLSDSRPYYRMMNVLGDKGEVIEMLQHAKPVTLATVATVIFVLFSLGSALFFEAYTTHLLVYLLVSGAVFFLIMLGAFKWLQNR